MAAPNPFHLSLTTAEPERQRTFYTEVLGCTVARTTAEFQDFDFFGHQLTFHRRAAPLPLPYESFHFGAIISWDEFDAVHARLQRASARFLIEPTEQAAGTEDARRKLVVLDPSGYAIELKCYRNPSRALAQAEGYARINPL
jgi:extradiol dioxygenase family protein